MRHRRIRTSRHSPFARGGALAAVALALTFAGCGGDDAVADAPTETTPAITAPVASELARGSDAVADALAAGDTCGAAHLADDLKARTLEAVDAGDVPEELSEELLAAADDLVNRVNCPPPPAPPAATEPQEDDGDDGDGEDGDDPGNGKGKGKAKSNDKGNPDGDDDVTDGVATVDGVTVDDVVTVDEGGDGEEEAEGRGGGEKGKTNG